MPTHDIIDNRSERLVDHVNRILSSTERAKFAVGYLFLSGLTPIGEKLKGMNELRLLIGNTTNRETLEQIAEGYKRLELVQDEAEAMAYPKRTEVRRFSAETAENVRQSMELMDQTDEAEGLAKTLVQMIEEKRLKVRVYTKGRLHAKAYIFDYRRDGRYEKREDRGPEDRGQARGQGSNLYSWPEDRGQIFILEFALRFASSRRLNCSPPPREERIIQI